MTLLLAIAATVAVVRLEDWTMLILYAWGLWSYAYWATDPKWTGHPRRVF